MNDELTIKALDSLSFACDRIADICETMVASGDGRISDIRYYIGEANESIHAMQQRSISPLLPGALGGNS